MVSRDADMPPQDQNGASDHIGPVTPGQQRRAAAAMPPDYRSLDYRKTNYRGLDYRANDYRSMDPAEATGGVDIMAALWRHRFAVIFPLLLGLAAGAGIFTTQPNVYRSSTQLLVESDQPSILDTQSGEMLNSVPGGDLLLAQLKSDKVLEAAAKDPALAQHLPELGGGSKAARGKLNENLTFEETADQSRGGGATVFLLHYDHANPVVATAAVTALSKSLEQYFADRSATSTSELRDLIVTAKDTLIPKITALEEEYKAFQDSTDLVVGEEGGMVNPFREKQIAMQERLEVMEVEARNLATKLAGIEDVVMKEKDPLVVMAVVSQLMGEELVDGGRRVSASSMLTPDLREDVSIAALSHERDLVPLQVQRAQYASQLGENHPEVVQLDKQIEITREKLNELALKESQRLAQLRNGSTEAKKRAADAIKGLVTALQTQQSVLAGQIETVKEEIKSLSDDATALAVDENTNKLLLRELDRQQELLDQVNEAFSRVDILASRDTSIVVEQLTEPTEGYLIAPVLSRFLLMGGFLGLLCGGGLAYLLESQAKTYHRTDEITQALGLPVLAHVPQDEQKLPRTRKGEVYPFADIDASLSVVHRPHSMASEAIRRLRTAVFFDANAHESRVFQITSPLPEDGKSTVSANLAASIAQAGKKVVLVDADLRRPQLSEVFGMRDKQGVSELVDGRCDPTQVILRTPIENLSVIPSGDIPANPAEALSMPQFGELIEWLRERYDYVIIDTPPLLIVTDPTIVAEHADAVVFAFRIRRGCRPQTKEAVSMLTAAGARVCGVVVNRSDEATASVGYRSAEAGSYHYRRYSYQEGRRSVGGTFTPRDKNFVVSGSNGNGNGHAKGSAAAPATDDLADAEPELPVSKS